MNLVERVAEHARLTKATAREVIDMVRFAPLEELRRCHVKPYSFKPVAYEGLIVRSLRRRAVNAMNVAISLRVPQAVLAELARALLLPPPRSES